MLTTSQQVELKVLKEDLKFQLTFEDIDWDYFKDTVERAKIIEDVKLK